MADPTVIRTQQPLLEQIREHRRRVYAAGLLTGRKGTTFELWPIGVQETAGEFLRDLVIREKAQRTIEVGLGLGLSTLFIAEALLAGRLAIGATHVVIEPMPELLDWAGYDQIQASGVLAVTTVVEEDSRLALPRLIGKGEAFDFAYVDGGHWFDFVFVDILNALRLVRPGGLIVVDDHWMPAVQTALGFVHANGLATLELYDPSGPGKRFVGVRCPERATERKWDHFVEFGRHTLPEYPWRNAARPLSSVDELCPRSS